MKKVINGKLYNTETATEICSYEYSNRGDFHYCQETLYVTKKGAYFIYGVGGPASKYSETVGQNEWSGGAAINVLTEAEARKFTEANATPETYAEFFGEAEEA